MFKHCLNMSVHVKCVPSLSLDYPGLAWICPHNVIMWALCQTHLKMILLLKVLQMPASSNMFLCKLHMFIIRLCILKCQAIMHESYLTHCTIVYHLFFSILKNDFDQTKVCVLNCFQIPALQTDKHTDNHVEKRINIVSTTGRL